MKKILLINHKTFRKHIFTSIFPPEEEYRNTGFGKTKTRPIKLTMG